MEILKDSTNVTTYFVLRLAATGVEATSLTITDIDLQYVRSGAAPSTKVDATALAAADSAHGDNQVFEVDATDQPGLIRVDWPDAAFATGVRQVILTVKYATCFTEHKEVDLVDYVDIMAAINTAVPSVNVSKVNTVDVTGTGGVGDRWGP